jgi:hypothetical protein
MRANSRLITGLDVAHATAISSGVPPPRSVPRGAVAGRRRACRNARRATGRIHPQVRVAFRYPSVWLGRTLGKR